ncbi:hypothetical protein BRADI_2g55303v3 [Brachypodium distachyon]|uniref:Uncharacterized protein n=1 Tax=Brachypodium distachyon TaxID=15368 RepID=A0A0Q3GHR8_BRADI|nr:hypothetical protein BRADI_2g55303v3 [Brachypodium distachyon]
MGLLDVGFDMAPTNFAMPAKGALAATGGTSPVEAATVPRRPRTVRNNRDRHCNPVRVLKGAILREMMNMYGEGKWAAIVKHLPGRIGKQCRARWMNHLRPELKKDAPWTEEDDKALIQEHMTLGNRWSEIARHLPGRSENSVKNHWNAVRRSLGATRQFKKKKSEQPPPGEFTVLEQYIRSKYPPSIEPTSPPPSGPASPSSGGPGSPNAAAPLALAGSSQTGMDMNFEYSAGSSNGGMTNLNAPLLLPGLNTYNSFPNISNLQYEMQVPALPVMVGTTDQEHLQAAPAYMNQLLNVPPMGTAHHQGNLPNLVKFEGQPTYYSEAAMGPSCTGELDDVVQMASREFATPSEDKVTFDPSKF